MRSFNTKIMEFLLIILVVVVWVSLYSHISKMNAHTDVLRRDILALRKYIESLQKEMRQQQLQQPLQPEPLSEPELKPEPQPIVKEELTKTAVEIVEKPVEVAIEKPKMKVEEKPVVRPVPETKKVVPPPVIKPFGPIPEKKKVNYEKYIGENLFGKIGILVLVVGMGLFVKYAIDKNWINEVFRTILGFVVGGVLLVISQRLKNTYRTFSSLLAGGAFAIFYVTVAMAYHYYGLFSQTIAFIILVVLTVLMSLLSVVYNRRELAVIGLIGGFIAPFLVSNGMGNYLILFTYMTILNMGMFGLSLYKKWRELPIISFVATYVIMLGYSLVADLDIARTAQLVHLLLFATLFYLIFLLPIVSVLRTENKKANQPLMLIVVLNNFIYLYFALWYLNLLDLPYNIKGAFTLFIALVNLALAYAIRSKKAETGYLFTALVGMFLTFVSITIPIQLDGNFITLLWATEMVAVLWLFTKFRQPLYEHFTLALFFLTIVSFLHNIEELFVDGLIRPLVLNGMFATGIFTGLTFGVFAWLMEREKELFMQAKNLKYNPLSAMAVLTGCGVVYLTFVVDFLTNITYRPLAQGACLAFTSLALVLLLVGLRRRFSMERYSVVYAVSVGISVCLFMWLSRIANGHGESSLVVLQWLALAVVVAHLSLLGKWYYCSFNFRQRSSDRMTSFIAIASTVLLAVVVHNMLYLCDWENESSAALSISLSVAGFVLMSLGMRLHLKILRMISLTVFGLVLLKLIIVDLWLLPTVGKIIVFIMLGVILLVLSFLYQKLKKALFREDEDFNN